MARRLDLRAVDLEASRQCLGRARQMLHYAALTLPEEERDEARERIALAETTHELHLIAVEDFHGHPAARFALGFLERSDELAGA